MSWLTKRTPEPCHESEHPKEQIEPLEIRKPWDYQGDCEKLLNLAREGDENAVRLLVHAGETFARAVEDLFRESVEGRTIVREIAAESVTWPSVVSRHQAFRGGPEHLKSYLEALDLGSQENLNFGKQDARTKSRQGAARLLRRIAEDHAAAKLFRSGLGWRESVEKTKFLRAGLERDPWRKSPQGKAAKAAIEEALAWIYKGDSWLEDEFLAPIVEPIVQRAKASEARRSTRSIKTEFIREALNLIHGTLWD